MDEHVDRERSVENPIAESGQILRIAQIRLDDGAVSRLGRPLFRCDTISGSQDQACPIASESHRARTTDFRGFTRDESGFAAKLHVGDDRRTFLPRCSSRHVRRVTSRLYCFGVTCRPQVSSSESLLPLAVGSKWNLCSIMTT